MRAPEKTFGRARMLRRSMTLPEVVLWQALRREQVAGMRFRRQHPIGPYILDFYRPAAHLAIEVDGWVHDTGDQAGHDERRQAWLEHQGVTVLHVRAADVLRDESLDGILRAIEAMACRPLRLPRIKSGVATSPASGGGTVGAGVVRFLPRVGGGGT